VEAVLVLIQGMVVLVALVAVVAAQEVMLAVLVHLGKVLQAVQAQIQILMALAVAVVLVLWGFLVELLVQVAQVKFHLLLAHECFMQAVAVAL
jgi:hypothetical protein